MRISVGVEVESRPSSSRWQKRVVRVVDIRPGTRSIPDWEVLDDTDGVVRYFAGSAKLAVHSTDTKVYKDNVEARQPSLYVVLRKGDSPVGWVLHLVTVDPTEAHSHVDVGDDLVEALPMPPPMRDWLALFVAQHHVERKEWKRKRDSGKGGGEEPPPGEGGFLDRWSQRKRGASRSAEARAAAPTPTPTPTPAPEPPPPAPPEGGGPDLPDVESLGPDSDYRAFLQAGVPKQLRNAALRRAWSSAPAIREHRPLVDYAWDFNAPGYGKLLPTDDASKLTASLFRHLKEIAEEPTAEGGRPDAAPADAAPADDPADPDGATAADASEEPPKAG